MICFVKLWLVNLLDLVNTVLMANFYAEYIYRFFNLEIICVFLGHLQHVYVGNSSVQFILDHFVPK